MLERDDLRAEVTRAKAAPARGMGRGLAAILSVSEPATEGDELRELPVDLDRAEPEPAAQGASTRRRSRRWPTRSPSGRPAAGARPPAAPAGRYELVAGERRWRAARLAGLERVPALVRPRDDAASLEVALIENMAREDLNPVEEARACAALVEELGLDPRGRRPPRRPQPRRRVEPAAPARPARRGARAARGGRPHRGPRPRAPARRGPRRPPPPGPRRGGRGLVGPRARGPRPRRQRARPARGAGRTAPRAALHPDQEEAVAEIAETLGAALGAEVRVRPARRASASSSSVADADEAAALAARIAEARRYTAASLRAISSVG